MLSIPPHNKASAGDQFTSGSPARLTKTDNMRVIALSMLFFFVVVGVFTFFFEGKEPAKPDLVADEPEFIPTTTISRLPGDNLDLPDSGTSTPDSRGEVKAEAMFYGDFYKPEDLGKSEPMKTYALPLNIKTDSSNFYDIARKINLDGVVEDLGKNGFAVIPNPFGEKTDNFFPVYQALLDKSIPVVVTSDFLLYYYQNSLKDVFKEIEGGIFYKELWEISKEFYEISQDRYLKRKKQDMGKTDRVLEAERLEAAYFAVALELLKPKDGQINRNAETDSSLFTQWEADTYRFEVPEYLKDDVAKEVEQILNPRGKAKSPVMLYARDYTEFKVPEDYLRNSKLNNFFLSSQWMNTVFPLYGKAQDCADCLLDHYDWTRSVMGSSFVVNDFSKNQNLKNRWAKIYKVVSFFKGLRQDLSYLTYHESFKKLFGESYDMESVWDRGNIEETLELITENVSKAVFSELEGSYRRDDAAQKPLLGLRMLQDIYWPNDYIYKNLTYPNTGFYAGPPEKYNDKRIISSCIEKKVSVRCKAIGLDIVNIYHPLSDMGEYFQLNSAFENYGKSIEGLRLLLGDFSAHTWHNNIYWSTLDINKKSLGNNGAGPAYSRTDKWFERDLNYALGSWTNIQLESDYLQYKWRQQTALSTSQGVSEFAYVEPNLALVNEIGANIDMLWNSMVAIGVLQKIDPAYGRLTELKDEYFKMRDIVKKELAGEALNEADADTINSAITRYSTVKNGKKEVKVFFPAADPYPSKFIESSIKGVKLLVVLNEFNGKKILGVGPMFNFTEAAK